MNYNIHSRKFGRYVRPKEKKGFLMKKWSGLHIHAEDC